MIDEELVLSLARLSFPLVRLRLYHVKHDFIFYIYFWHGRRSASEALLHFITQPSWIVSSKIACILLSFFLNVLLLLRQLPLRRTRCCCCLCCCSTTSALSSFLCFCFSSWMYFYYYYHSQLPLRRTRSGPAPTVHEVNDWSTAETNSTCPL